MKKWIMCFLLSVLTLVSVSYASPQVSPYKLRIILTCPIFRGGKTYYSGQKIPDQDHPQFVWTVKFLDHPGTHKISHTLSQWNMISEGESEYECIAYDDQDYPGGLQATMSMKVNSDVVCETIGVYEITGKFECSL